MVHPIPDEFPKTLAEWPAFIQNAYEWRKQEYEAKVAEAKQKAQVQWDAELPATLEAMQAQAKVNINAEMVDTPEGPRPLTEQEKQQKLEEAYAAINQELAEEKRRYVEITTVGIEQPPTLQQIEQEFSFGKPKSEEEIAEIENQALQDNSFSYDAYYQIGDGRVYSVKGRGFVNARSVPADAHIIKVNDDEQQFRWGVLEYYKTHGFPDVKIGFELLTLEECKEAQIRDVDAQVSENIKAGFSYPLTIGRTADTFYFSLSEIDQINFANMSNAANLLIQGKVDQSISWQVWRSPAHRSADVGPVVLPFSPQKFLEVYLQGALKHINDCLDQGRVIKDNIRKATTKAEVAALVVRPTEIAKAISG